MPFADAYLAKHGFAPAIDVPPHPETGIIVTMPCCDEPDVLHSLASLHACTRPACNTEVIVVVNHSDAADMAMKRRNEECLHHIHEWCASHNSNKLQTHVIRLFDVPDRYAGVGFARKTAMDEAASRFNRLSRDGVIAGFDADAVCETNYLLELERCFASPDINGVSVRFEHPLDGNDFPPAIYDGIRLYELHLRYLNEAMRYTGFPYAFLTLGSSFAVRASAYVKQGGMNRRKAGEDFHFLHKIIPLGGYVELNSTCIIPSPRVSTRVPFGTGAAMRQWLSDGTPALFTYPLQAFDGLKAFFEEIPNLFYDFENATNIIQKLPIPMRAYLEQTGYAAPLAVVRHNSASLETFGKRFFAWFDALQIVRYLNSSCNGHYTRQPPEVAATELLHRLGERDIPMTEMGLLERYRKGILSTLKHSPQVPLI